ncbi:MAG TPA: CBS domain-containing protein [Burkholderiales bacterium]|nr:CBS domain-containing protein [Burkholderiales bacterium]
MAELKVKDIMSREVRTVQRNDQLALADRLMRDERIRHLPVLDEAGDVCAVVSQRDLFRGALLRALGYGSRAEDSMLRQVVVKEAMSAEIFTTAPETPLAEAARVMIERQIGCLPVLDAGKLVGIVTETDFVRLIADGKVSA